MNNLYDVLEICLQDLDKGADLDTVLFRYPEYADELRPILEASINAKSVAASDPAPDVVRRNRSKVLQQAAQMREARVHSSRRLWSVPLRRALVSLAVIAALFVSGTGLVQASSTTLPGDNLYPVKRTWEDVRLLFTFNGQLRESLEIEHESERLEELYELFAEGRSAEVDFAGTITRQDGDLWLVAKIPVVVSSQTELRDSPMGVGDAVRVRGLSQPDGTVLAERIDLLDAGEALPDVADDDDSSEFEEDENDNGNDSREDNSGTGSREGEDDNEGTEENDNDSNRGSGRDDNADDSDDSDDNSGSGNQNNNEEDNSGNDDNSGSGSDDEADDSRDNDDNSGEDD